MELEKTRTIPFKDTFVMTVKRGLAST